MKLQRKVLLTGLSLLLLATSSFAITDSDHFNSTPPLSKARQLQLMQILGSQAPELLGISIDKLSLLSFRKEGLVKIPFQIDEVNTEGFSHFDSVNIPIDGTLGILDKNDKLIFLMKDSGARFNNMSPRHNNANSTNNTSMDQIISEIEIETEHGSRFVYVTQNTQGNINLSDKNASTIEPNDNVSHVNYNEETGIISTDFYSLHIDPENPINWNDYTYTTFSDDTKTSILDTLKIRLNGGVFSRFAPITIDNDNLKAKIVDIKHGPLTTTLLLKTKVVIASVPVMKILVYFDIMPQQIVFNARVHIPKVAKRVLIDPKMSISLDGNNLKGSILQTAMMPNITGHVDGHISKMEKKLLKNELNNENNWIWFSTKKGFDLLAFMEVPEQFDIPIKLLYQDDDSITDKPERFQGQGPNIGYQLSGLPAGATLAFKANLVFTDNIGDMTPQHFAAQIQSLPNIHSSNTERIAQTHFDKKM